MSGYIKLHRGWRDTDGFLPSDYFSDFEAWIWLLEHAAWKDISRWNAKGEEIRLKPGQIHISLRSLSTAWGWSKSKVERFLGRLENVQKARQSPGQSGIVLTIENWVKYQGGEVDTETATGTASGQPRDTQKEGKEIKEKKNTKAYAFEGDIIRLTQRDFDRWQTSFNLLDLGAQLMARDAWLQSQPGPVQKGWYHSTASLLAKKQQEAKSQKVKDDDPMVNFIT